jgi:cytochrome c oxidase subunit II
MNQWSLRLLVVVAQLPFIGCRSTQSVLFPQGPRAAEIEHLAWILFGFGGIVLAAVVLTLWLAVSGPSGVRSTLSSREIVVGGGIIFPAITLTGLLTYSLWLMQAGVRSSDRNEVYHIGIIGEQWWWRVSYRGADGREFASANEIHIPMNRVIEFTLQTADVIHSFWVPNLAGKLDMIPGRTTRLVTSADRSGIFRGQCAEYCGGPHALMAFRVIAMPQDQFEAWLARESAPALHPATEQEARGQAVFLSAGCGACHTIRGTKAKGTVGPDLTHVGARQAIGADTLPMNRINLERFVSENQHIKPGNIMPEFRIFSAPDRMALAAYLLSLR